MNAKRILFLSVVALSIATATQAALVWEKTTIELNPALGAPSLRERHHFRRGHRRLPRDFVAVINRLASGGKQGEADENSALPKQRLHGLAVPGGITRAWA